VDSITLAVERLTDAVLRALEREEPSAAAVRLLLRRYAATGRDDILHALEHALTRALDAWPQAPRDDLAGWLMLFAEAAAVSEDERVHEAAGGLAAVLRESWGRERRVAVGAAGVDACLRAEAAGLSGAGLQAAVDELERLVGSAYEPGEGLSRAAAGGHALADHVSAASALLTAYECTGRLPYSMLAEELMQFVARTLGDAGAPGFADGETASKPFAFNCEAASVLYRLDALHRSAEYREAAVVAPAADYGRDAEGLLRWLAPQVPETGLGGAVYGLAAAGFDSAL
jgi:uncharacterized protein YyaL (SSP411 family)